MDNMEEFLEECIAESEDLTEESQVRQMQEYTVHLITMKGLLIELKKAKYWLNTFDILNKLKAVECEIDNIECSNIKGDEFYFIKGFIYTLERESLSNKMLELFIRKAIVMISDGINRVDGIIKFIVCPFDEDELDEIDEDLLDDDF